MKYLFCTLLLSLGIQSVSCQETTAGNALLLDFYRSENAPCNICGADDGVLGKGEVILPAGTAGILQEERTCAEVQELALGGFFRPASCLLLPFRLFELCGCISSQPPPVFPPEERQDPEPTVPEATSPPVPVPAPMMTATTTVFIVLEGLDSLLDSESSAVFEQVCADFLVSELAGDLASDDLTCTIENQVLVIVEPAVDSADGDSGGGMTAVTGVQLEIEIMAETAPSVDLGALVTDALGDGLSGLIEALQDASDAFNSITGGSISTTSAPTPAPTTVVVVVDPDGDDDDILGIDRNLFIAIASGCGAFLFMMLILCTCGRGTAGGPIRKSNTRQNRPEQPIY